MATRRILRRYFKIAGWLEAVVIGFARFVATSCLQGFAAYGRAVHGHNAHQGATDMTPHKKRHAANTGRRTPMKSNDHPSHS